MFFIPQGTLIMDKKKINEQVVFPIQHMLTKKALLKDPIFFEKFVLTEELKQILVGCDRYDYYQIIDYIPSAIRFIRTHSWDLQVAVIKRDPSCFKHIKDPYPDIVKMALSLKWENLNHIEATKELVLWTALHWDARHLYDISKYYVPPPKDSMDRYDNFKLICRTFPFNIGSQKHKLITITNENDPVLIKILKEHPHLTYRLTGYSKYFHLKVAPDTHIRGDFSDFDIGFVYWPQMVICGMTLYLA